MSFSAPARRRMLGAAVVLAVVVAVLTYVVAAHRDLADDLDSRLGLGPTTWRDDVPWLRDVLLGVEAAFGTIGMTVILVLAAGLLWFRKHPRAAVWLLVGVTGARVTTYLLKRLVDRPRPVLEDPISLVSDPAFPSGHATSAGAAAAVIIVLATLFVRRRSLRRLLAVLAVAFALVIALDRILLGVHGALDVTAGWAVGVAWVLATTYFYDPAPKPTVAEPLPSPLPSTRRLAVILNPIKVEDPGQFRHLVDGMAAESGWAQPTWYETTIEDPGRSMAEAAAIGGAELVIVCGGDGTVRTVCAELAGTGIPVGVVPAGTGNLLARNLDLPLYLRSAVDVALNGQDRAIDLVRISGDGIAEDEHFLVMAGMGFDAAIMEGANEQIKARVGWLAYVVSGLRNLMYPVVRLEVSVDDGPFTKHRARTVVVGNVGFLQAGLPLLPDAAIDDGRLDVVMIYPRRFLSWLRIVFRVLSRNSRTDETLDRMTGRKVVLRASAATPRQIDGDAIGPGKELVCESLHGRLLVRVPR